MSTYTTPHQTEQSTLWAAHKTTFKAAVVEAFHSTNFSAYFQTIATNFKTQ